MTAFTLEQVPATTVATMHRRVPTAELQDFFGSAFEHVAAAVGDAGGHVATPPFAEYHGMPTDTVDVSAGFPVVGDVHTPDGGVVLATRPGGRAAVAEHVGPYSGLAQAWRDLVGWVDGQGLHPTGDMWEEYLTAPEGDPAHWRTRVVVLVA